MICPFQHTVRLWKPSNPPHVGCTYVDTMTTWQWQHRWRERTPGVCTIVITINWQECRTGLVPPLWKMQYWHTWRITSHVKFASCSQPVTRKKKSIELHLNVKENTIRTFFWDFSTEKLADATSLHCFVRTIYSSVVSSLWPSDSKQAVNALLLISVQFLQKSPHLWVNWTAER